jgi:pimeloyl-ACP methyl ester carboxylesterase
MNVWTLNGSFDFRDFQIRYGIVGPEAAPALVLMHGTPFSSWEWHRIVPWLARRFRVHFHDMLGYGASEKLDGDVSLGVQNAVFAALLDHWALRRPHVVAHDFGGATALRAHLLDGRDYASLTLIDPVAIRPWGSPFVAHVRAHEAAFAGLPAYAHEALLEAYLKTSMARPIRQDELAPYMAPWLGEAGRAGVLPPDRPDGHAVHRRGRASLWRSSLSGPGAVGRR